MQLNVEFQIELPKTNPSLAESHLQRKTRGYAQKPPLTIFIGIGDDLRTNKGEAWNGFMGREVLMAWKEE